MTNLLIRYEKHIVSGIKYLLLKYFWSVSVCIPINKLHILIPKFIGYVNVIKYEVEFLKFAHMTILKLRFF